MRVIPHNIVTVKAANPLPTTVMIDRCFSSEPERSIINVLHFTRFVRLVFEHARICTEQMYIF